MKLQQNELLHDAWHGETKIKEIRKQIVALEAGARIPSAKCQLVELHLPPSGYSKPPSTSASKAARSSPSSGSTTARSNNGSQGICLSSRDDAAEAAAMLPRSPCSSALTPQGSQGMPLSARGESFGAAASLALC